MGSVTPMDLLHIRPAKGRATFCHREKMPRVMELPIGETIPLEGIGYAPWCTDCTTKHTAGITKKPRRR